MNTRAQNLQRSLAAAIRYRALRDRAEDLIGQALVTSDPAQRAELADDALATAAAAQRAGQEASG